MWWIWKILSFFIAVLGLSLVASLMAHLWIGKAIPRDPATSKLKIKIDPWLLATVTLSVSLLMTHYLDHRPLMSLGLHFYSSWWKELVLGIILGGIMLMAMATVLWTYNKQNITFQFTKAKFASVLGHLRGAIGEELVVRGYPLQTLVGAMGLYPAVLVTSAFFGLLHYQSQRLIEALATTLAGLLLATAVLKTNALWLAVGIHFSWNFAEALFNLGEVNSRERYLAEMLVIILFWLLLLALPTQPHPEMEKLWNEYILKP